MAIKPCNYSDVLAGSAARAGFVLSDVGVPEFQLFRTFHNSRLKRAWRIHRWPELCPIEQRSFRAPYDTTGGTTYQYQAQVLDVATQQYYQCLFQGGTNQPPSLNGCENSAFWAVCRSWYGPQPWLPNTPYNVGDQVYDFVTRQAYQCITAEVSGATMTYAHYGVLTPFERNIAQTQPWETNVIGEYLAAWDRDPRITTKRCKLRYELDQDGAVFTQGRFPFGATGGVGLGGCAYVYVWLLYRLPCPVLTGDVYDPTVVYTAGQQFYYTSTVTGAGNFYNVVTTTTAGDTPDTVPAKFSLVTIPYIFEEHLKIGGYCDWLTSDGQAEKATGIENDPENGPRALLEAEADILQRQSQQVWRLDVN